MTNEEKTNKVSPIKKLDNIYPDLEITTQRILELTSTLNDVYNSSGMLVAVESMRQITNSIHQSSVSPILESTIKSIGILRESIGTAYNSEIMDSFSIAAELMEKMNAAPAIEATIRNMREMTEAMSRVSAINSYGEIIKTVGDLITLSREISTAAISPDGSINFITSLGYEEEITFDDISYTLNEEGFFDPKTTLDSKLNSIMEELNLIRNHQVQNADAKVSKKDIILLLLGWIIPMIITPWIAPHIENYSEWASQNSTKIVKVLKTEIKESMEKENYKKIRIINKHGLRQINVYTWVL